MATIKLIGDAPNQVSRNRDLGELAFLDTDNAILESGSIDLKGGGSNLLTYSEQFDNSTAWTTFSAGDTEVGNATTAPDGTTTADLTVEGAVSGRHGVIRNLSDLPLNQNHVLSVYMKMATRSIGVLYVRNEASTLAYAWFDLSSGTIGTVDALFTASILDVGNGWYRCSVVFDSGATNSTTAQVGFLSAQTDGVSSFLGDGSGVYLWGAQLEQSSSVGNYVKTEAASYTLENAPGAVAVSIPSSSQLDTTYPMAFELASDTSLVVKVKGSDGQIRTATLTLS